jgi:hypothetical protein
MAVTRLERKGRKNKARAKARVKRIKLLNQRPVIKNVDVEAIKAEFAKNLAAKSSKKETAPVAEVATEAVTEEVTVVAEEAPKAKKKAPAKKKED